VRAGFIIASASIGGFALVAWGAMARVNHDIDEAFGDWPNLHPEMRGMKAAAQKDRLGWPSELGPRPSVIGSQTIQVQNSTHSKPRIKSGRGAK
jgi:hypothetical protein